jgi:hypothetical protein
MHRVQEAMPGYPANTGRNRQKKTNREWLVSLELVAKHGTEPASASRSR